MAFAARTTAVMLVFFLVVIGDGCALQIFLSRRKPWWPGLILPALTLLYALAVLAGAAITQYSAGVFVFLDISMLPTLLILFLPTLVLLAIYFLCRSGQRRQKLLEKMDIQDL